MRTAESGTAGLTKYAWLSIAAAVVTIGLKTGAYLLTGSVGLLSDAAESLREPRGRDDRPRRADRRRTAGGRKPPLRPRQGGVLLAPASKA